MNSEQAANIARGGAPPPGLRVKNKRGGAVGAATNTGGVEKEFSQKNPPLTATLENGDSMQQTVTYVPNVANAEITLAASKDPVIADNNDLTTLTATVADTEGNAIANTEVTFTLPEDVKANFTLSDGGKAVTDAEGKAKVTLKGTKAGAHTVTASMAGGKSEQLVVNFIADTLTAQVNLNVTEDNFIANNVGMTGLQATVTDGNGNPLANEAVTFTLPADVSEALLSDKAVPPLLTSTARLKLH